MKKALLGTLTVMVLALVGWFAFVSRGTTPQAPVVAPGPDGAWTPGQGSGAASPLDAPQEVGAVAASAPAVGGEGAARANTPRATAGEAGDWELQQGHWVEGKVVLAPDTPLDEEVWVLADGREFTQRPKHRAKVGPDGKFRVAFARDTRVGWLRLEARYNYLEEPPPVRTNALPGEVVLRGKLGGCVRGVVRIDAEAQARAAQVAAKGRVSVSDNEFDFMGMGSKPGRILPDLAYVVGGLEPGTNRHVVVKADGFVPGRVKGIDVQIGRITTVDVDLHLGATIGGRVVDPDGAPLAGVRVIPQYKNDDSDGARLLGMLEQNVRTDDAGKFQFSGLGDGALTLVCQKPGFEPLFHEVGLVSTTTRSSNLEITLGRGLSISGRVLQRDGKPADRTLVNVEDAEGRDFPTTPEGISRWILKERDPVEAAPDGTFRVQGLQPGRYVVTARGWNGAEATAAVAAERAEEKKQAEAEAEQRPVMPRKVVRRGAPLAARVEGVVSGAENLALTLEPGDRLRGRAVDHDGNPIERFTVHAEPDRKSAGYSSDVDGFERLFRSKDGTFTLEGLRPCGWNLHVTARGYMDSTSLPVVIPGANDDTTFRLLKQAKLVGVVLDPDRKPVAGARVVASPTTGGWRGQGDRAVTRTDAKGAFALVSVPVGSVRVHAEANGYTRSASQRFEIGTGVTREGLELVLARGGSVRGEVIGLDGKKAAGRSVEIHAIGEDFDKTTRTDAEGRFAFDALPAARYRVSADDGDKRDLARLGGFADVVSDPELDRIVTVTEGAVVDVTLGHADPSFVRLHGRVIGSTHVERVVAEQVAAGPDRSPLRRANPMRGDETYEIVLPNPGRWHVTFEGGRLGVPVGYDVDVPAGAECERDFQLPEGRIAGHVRDSEGKGVARVEVRILQAGTVGGPRGDKVTTDTDGSFEFAGLADGTYALRTEDFDNWWERSDREAGLRATKKGIVVEKGAAVKDVELVLAEPGTLTGVVRGADGSPMPYATLHVFDGDGHSLPRRFGQRTADAAGRFRVEDAPEGRVWLAASTPQSAGKAAAVVRADGEAAVEVQLRPAAELVLVAQDEQGRPTFAQFTLTDEDGRRFDEAIDLSVDNEAPPGGRIYRGLPAGRYVAVAHATGGRSARGEVRLADGRRSELVLRQAP